MRPKIQGVCIFAEIFREYSYSPTESGLKIFLENIRAYVYSLIIQINCNIHAFVYIYAHTPSSTYTRTVLKI